MQIGRMNEPGKPPTYHITLSEEEANEIIATPLIAEPIREEDGQPKSALITMIEALQYHKEYREEICPLHEEETASGEDVSA